MARAPVVYAIAGIVLIFLFFNVNFRREASQRPPVDPAPWRAEYTPPTKTPVWPDPVDTTATQRPTRPPFINYKDPDEVPTSTSTTRPSKPTHSDDHDQARPDVENDPALELDPNKPHPIESLISHANEIHEGLLSRRSRTVDEAARAYRTRRGRHPPPGFDKWFEYALQNDAIIVEEFWDQIYHDLEPFWALPQDQVRAQARALGMGVIVENGQTQIHTDWFWHVIWEKMIKEVSFMLPDMIVPLNSMDESRLLVPWETINEYVDYAAKHKKMPAAKDVKQRIKGWREHGDKEVAIPHVTWNTVAPYSFARAACDPHSPIRKDYKVLNSGVMTVHETRNASYSNHGFVYNSSMSQDFCQDASIAAYHAALIQPLTASTASTLQPLFGGSKLAVNNEVLVPAPMYWNGEERFEQDDEIPWSAKLDRVIWRGTATGGRHNAMTWPHFQRHRFVALANGTKYALADRQHDRIYTPAQRHAAIAPLPKPIKKNLKNWLNKRNDVALTDHFCDVPSPNGTCWYTDSEYRVADLMPLKEQYKHKFLPDLDGNSFSGRYRSFLMSSSVPIKATLYREWHDSRLIAWKHFVPMNNRFTDYYAILAYFMGCEKDVCGADGIVVGHDAQAEAIAKDGSAWAKKVLRKVDMQIYMARLLLEYARVTDDDRDRAGWVADILWSDSPPAQVYEDGPTGHEEGYGRPDDTKSDEVPYEEYTHESAPVGGDDEELDPIEAADENDNTATETKHSSTSLNMTDGTVERPDEEELEVASSTHADDEDVLQDEEDQLEIEEQDDDE